MRRAKRATRVPALLSMVSVLTAASTGGAELIPSDHPNPQLARITFDTETGLSWLDVTESVGLSYADVEAGAGGFVTEGWRHATIGEVCALFERYLPAVYPPAMSCPIVGTDFPTPTDSGFALEFLRFLGTTGHTDGLGGSGTRGLAAGPSPPEAGQVILGLPTYYAGVTQNPGDTLSSSSPTVGHFLVRDDLPRKLPALSGSAVLGLAASLSCAAFRFLRPGDTRPGSRS